MRPTQIDAHLLRRTEEELTLLISSCDTFGVSIVIIIVMSVVIVAFTLEIIRLMIRASASAQLPIPLATSH